ncbi:MAG: chorismate mutase [Oscillospiraceae bacterium]
MDLNLIRSDIDDLDREIVNLLIKRFTIVYDVATFKKQNNIPVLQLDREKQVLDKIKILGNESFEKELGLLYSYIMDLSKSLQYNFVEANEIYVKDEDHVNINIVCTLNLFSKVLSMISIDYEIKQLTFINSCLNEISFNVYLNCKNGLNNINSFIESLIIQNIKVKVL